MILTLLPLPHPNTIKVITIQEGSGMNYLKSSPVLLVGTETGHIYIWHNVAVHAAIRGHRHPVIALCSDASGILSVDTIGNRVLFCLY